MMMRKILVVVLFLFFLIGFFATGARVAARERGIELLTLLIESTESGELATMAGSLQIEEAEKEDITERGSPVTSKLEQYLAEKDPGPLKLSNFLQRGIRTAVSQGVSPNTIVLVLLFPLVAGLIAGGRHLLGLTGFGIFVPAILAVAFLATGVKVGMIMFVIIWSVATAARRITQKLKLQYLP